MVHHANTRAVQRLTTSALIVLGSIGQNVGAQTSVRLSLNWPINVEVEAHTTRTTIRRAGAETDSSQSSATRRFVVRSHPEGLMVSLDADTLMEMRPINGGQASVGYLSNVVARDLIVSRDGRFLRLNDTVALARRTRERWTTGLSAQITATPAFEATIQQLVSMERTTGRSRREWDDLIGHLVGREWTEGPAVTDTAASTNDLATGMQSIDLRTVTFRGVTACPANSGAQQCWRFDTHIALDSAALRRSIRNNAARFNLEAKDVEAFPLPYHASFSTHVLDAATGRPLRHEVSDAMIDPPRTFIGRRVTVYTWRPM